MSSTEEPLGSAGAKYLYKSDDISVTQPTDSDTFSTKVFLHHNQRRN